MTEDLHHHSKVPLFPRDHFNNKKVLAVHKDRKQLQSKLRTMGHMDYSRIRIEKAQPEMVSLREHINEQAKLPNRSYYLMGIVLLAFTMVPLDHSVVLWHLGIRVYIVLI